MSSLTQGLRAACRELVREQLQREAPFFDHVWEAFWQTLGCKEIEDLQASIRIGHEATSIRVLGAVAVGGQELDTLFVLGSITSSMATLLANAATTPITVNRIAEILKQEFLRINTPDHLRPVLFEHGIGLLAGLLGVERAEKEDTAVITCDQLWVEHCAERTDPSQFAAIARDHYNLIAVETEFRQQRHVYDLFVDELVPCIYLPQTDAPPVWSEIAPRHRRLLGLILEAFSNQRMINYTTICKRALKRLQHAHETYSIVYDGPSVRRTISELHRHLQGVLKGILKAERTENRYVLKGQIAYCWIRQSNQSSRLI